MNIIPTQKEKRKEGQTNPSSLGTRYLTLDPQSGDRWRTGDRVGIANNSELFLLKKNNSETF